MANQEHLDILQEGVDAWNKWRTQHSVGSPDLSGANLYNTDLSDANLNRADLSDANLYNAILRGANLRGANLRGAILTGATLSQADLSGAKLSGADLSGAKLYNVNLSRANLYNATLSGADLSGAKLSGATLGAAILRGATLSDANLYNATLSGATLSGAILSGATLTRADLSRANLSQANLSQANLSRADLNGANFNGATLSGATLSWATIVNTNLTRAILNDCAIYGIAAWDVQLEGAQQLNLVITPPDQPTITVDNLKIAQFIYLLLNNKEIREVIDTITSKVVLILGRFTPERKAVLNALRDELRKQNYLPVLFDFDKPASRDLTETITTLAHLARFIIVDLTDPSSAPHEVATIIPQTVVPVQPLLTLQPLTVDGKTIERNEYAMFEDLRRRYHWVLPTFRFQDTADLLAALQEHIIEPAELKAKELAQR